MMFESRCLSPDHARLDKQVRKDKNSNLETFSLGHGWRPSPREKLLKCVSARESTQNDMAAVGACMNYG